MSTAPPDERARRISPQDVRNAYTATGLRPTRHGFADDDDGAEQPTCLCPAAVTAEAAEPGLFTENRWTEDGYRYMAICRVLSLTTHYIDGFIDAVDGFNPEHLTNAQYLMGYADGRAVAQDLFDDERNGGMFPGQGEVYAP